MKVALRELDPWTFRTVCLLVGGGGLLVLVRAGGQSLRVPRAERWPLAVVAFFNITAWHLCSAYGLTLVQAGRAAIIAYTMPLWTVVFGRLLVGERITRARLAALGLGLGGHGRARRPRGTHPLGGAGRHPPHAGCCRVVGDRHRADQGQSLDDPDGRPDGLADRAGRRCRSFSGAAVRLAGSGDAGLLSRLGTLSAGALLGTAYATLIGVIFCHWAWFRLVAILPAAVAAIGTLGIPVVGLFTSALVLGEPVGSAEVVALVLVVAGLGILVGDSRAERPDRCPGTGPSQEPGGSRLTVSARSPARSRPTLRLLPASRSWRLCGACAAAPDRRPGRAPPPDQRPALHHPVGAPARALRRARGRTDDPSIDTEAADPRLFGVDAGDGS